MGLLCEGAVKTYSQKLKDPRWQKMRLEVLERDEWSCTLCGDAENTLHVHHCYYDSSLEPWDYPKESLKTVCEDCHRYADRQRVALQHIAGFLSLEARDQLILLLATVKEFTYGGQLIFLAKVFKLANERREDEAFYRSLRDMTLEDLQALPIRGN